MKETPILFTPDNIRAIIEGRKTQTRRVWKKQPYKSSSPCPRFSDTAVGDLFICPDLFPTEPGPVGHVITECTGIGNYHSMGTEAFIAKHGPKNYGVVGDKLYVKEGVIIHGDGRTLAGYYMDGARVTNLGESRRTAMFMPKWAARYWLEITDVRVERLQDISDEDCFAEGIHRFGSTEMYGHNPKGTPGPLVGDTPKDAYRLLWDSINRKKHPWSSNPWVFVIDFKKVEK